MTCTFCSCFILVYPISSLFFFNDTATTEIYTLSLHDALPIFLTELDGGMSNPAYAETKQSLLDLIDNLSVRSEEHTSELQSRPHLVCRLLLEKKKSTTVTYLSLSCSRRCMSLYCTQTRDTGLD